MSAPERRATSFSGTLAVVVAALAALALGAAAGATGATVASLGGAVAAALGVRAVQTDANDRRAAGSVGVVAAAVAFAGVATLGGRAVALLAGVGVAAVAINAAVALDSSVERPVWRTFGRSATVLTVGAALAAGVHAGVFAALAAAAVGGIASAVTAHDLSRLVALQVELLVVLELLHLAVPILDDWLPEERDLRAATLGRLDYRTDDVPRAYWLFFALQLVLALTRWGPRWFDDFLGSLSTLGAVVRLALRSGVLHGALGGFVAALAAVLVGRGLQLLFVAWAGPDPPRALAHAAGGVTALAAAALIAASPLADAVVETAGPSIANPVAAFGATATLTGTVALTLFAVAVGRSVLGRAVRPWVASDAGGGFAVGAGALVAAALVASDGGASALAVFAGVAAGLVVFDLGTNAVGLGTTVGPLAETRAGEATHAVGSLLVAAGGVALATLTAFAMGSVTISVPAWRARLAVALLLVAVLCFAVLLGRE